MGRIRGVLQINGKRCWTLFDTGARNTYITSAAAKGEASWTLPEAEGAAIGGRNHRILKECMVMGQVEGHWVRTRARVVDSIGNDEEGRPIDILFGALAMQEWGIRLVPEEERLDLTHYPREFVEFPVCRSTR